MAKYNFFLSMVKVGIMGFGGGNALIPVIQKEIVDEKKLITEEEYEEDVLVASITPGALPVEIAGGVGGRIAGWKGTVLGSVGIAMPGVLLSIFIMAFINCLDDVVTVQINYITIGITAYISCLLTDYLVKTLKKVDGTRAFSKLCIVLLVFLATCGKKLHSLLEVRNKPYIVLSTIQVFIIAFLCVIVMSFFNNNITEIGDSKLKKKYYRDVVTCIVKEICIVLLIFGVCMLLVKIINSDVFRYMFNTMISSLLSFGGGDAYLTVADGLFVETALVSEDVFYGQIVPIVNLLPGSILCKTASCVGFVLGYRLSNSIFFGCLLAFIGFLGSVFASCGIFIVVKILYKNFGEFRFFLIIKNWIRPIVSGLMLAVILSFMSQIKKIEVIKNVDMASIMVFGVIYILNLVMYYKVKMRNFMRVLLSVIMAVLVCNFI